MTSAEKILWNELRANKLGVHFRRHTAPAGGAGGKSFKDSLLTSTAISPRWLSKWMETFMIYNKRKIQGVKRLCVNWG